MWTIREWYEKARLDAQQHAAYLRGMADHTLNAYAQHAPHLPRQRLLDLLEANNRERLDAVPDLTRYPELRGMRDLIDARWRGQRDGAGLSPEQFIAWCDSLSFYRRRVDDFATGTIGCTRVFFPDSDVGPILGSNLDTDRNQPFEPPAWLPLNEHLVYSGVSCGIWCDEKSPERFPAPVTELLARYCRTTREAVDMLRRYNHFWGPCNLLIVDRAKEVAMIEKSACRMGVRYSTDGFGFVTAMTMEELAMHAWLDSRRKASLVARDLPDDCADTRYWAEADQRRALLNELLADARKQPTFENMCRIMQFRDPERGRVAYHGDILYPGAPPTEYTLTTVIWRLRQASAAWWAIEGDTPSWEHRREDVHFQDVFAWD